MYRRLYYLFPTATEAEAAFDTLCDARIHPRHIHAIAREGTRLDRLPAATPNQRRGLRERLARWFWDGELGLFAVALVAFVVSLFWGFSWWSAAALVVILVTVVSGGWYAMMIPELSLGEFRHALDHGEVLLLVDVPAWRQAEIEKLIESRHPAALPGGGSWTVDALGL